MAFSGLSFPALTYGNKFRLTKVTTNWPVAVAANSGFEYRVLRFGYPRMAWSFPARNLTWQDKETLLTFWNKLGGGLQSFLYTDPEHNTLVGQSLLLTQPPVNATLSWSGVANFQTVPPLTVTNYVFATGVSNTTGFTITAPNGLPIKSFSSFSLYRSDWQGNQLLYPTPRTNALIYSSDMTNAAWTTRDMTATNNGTLGPNGGNASLISATLANSFPSIKGNAAIGNTIPFTRIGIKAASVNFCALFIVNGNGGYASFFPSTITIISGPGVTSQDSLQKQSYITGMSATEWTIVGLTALDPITLGNNCYLYVGPLQPSGLNNVGDSLYVSVAQICAQDGSYIPTTSAPVTLTDYTITGVEVNLGAGTQINPPSVPTLASTTGTLVAATYTYAVTATNAQGETIASTQASITLAATGGVTITPTAVTGATGYKVYGRSGTLGLLGSTTGASFTDSGSVTPGIASPSVNGTGTLAYPAVILIAGANHPLFHIDGLTITPTPASFQIINGSPQITYAPGSAPAYGTLVVVSGSYSLCARFDSMAGYALQNAVDPETSAVSMDAIKLIEVFE